MSTKPVGLLCAIAGFSFGFATICARPLAAQNGCQPMFSAQDKILTTPAHIYSTSGEVGQEKPRTTETIYVAGAIYVTIDGKWTRSRMTPADMAQQEKENRQNSKSTCRYVKDELVNGEIASVYEVHSENDSSKTDGQFWLSKGKGLPLRGEFDIDIGGGPGKYHHSVRYEYGNVKAPL